MMAVLSMVLLTVLVLVCVFFLGFVIGKRSKPIEAYVDVNLSMSGLVVEKQDPSLPITRSSNFQNLN